MAEEAGGKKVVLTAELKESISESLKKVKEGFSGLAETGSQANQKLAAAMRDTTKAVDDHAVAVEKASKEHVTFRSMLTNTHTSVNNLASGVLSLTGSLLKIGTGFAAVVGGAEIFGQVKDALVDCYNSAKDAEQTETKLNVTLADTGKITGVTKEQLDSLTESLMMHTTYSKDTIESAEGVMAAFTNISSKVFPGAMQATADLSAKMGLDLPNAARLIGRALDNPTTGMLTMTRYGITLTAAMKAQIQTFLKHGETAKAQGVILDALKTKFGGVADAIGSTLQGKMTIFSNQLEAVKESIGLAVIPILSRLLDIGQPVLEFLATQIPKAFQAVADIGTNVVLPFFQRVQDAFTNLRPYILFAGQALLNILQPAFMSIVDGLKTIFLPLWNTFQTAVGHFSADKGAQNVKTMGSNIMQLGGAVGNVLSPILQLVGVILKLAGVLVNDALRGFVTLLGPMNTMQGQAKGIGGVLKDVFVGTLSTVVSGLQKFTTFLQQNSPAAIAVKVALAGVAAAILACTAPVTAIVVGIGLLAAVFLHFYNTNVGFHDLVANIAAILGGVFHAALSGIGTVLGVVGNILGVVFGKLGDLWSIVGPKIIPALGDLHNHFADISSGIVDLLMPAINSMITALKVALPIAIGIVLLVLQGMQKSWNTVWPYLSIVVQTAFNVIKTIFGTLFGLIGNTLTLIGDLLHGRWGKIFDDAKKIVTDWLGGIFSLLGNLKDGFLNILGQIWKDIGGSITGGLGAVKTTVGNNLSSLGKQWDAFWNGLIGVVDAILKAIYDNTLKPLGDLVALWMKSTQGIRDAIGGVLNWIVTSVGGLLNFLLSIFTTIGQILLALTTKAWAAVRDFIGGILDAVLSKVGGVLDAIIGDFTRGFNIIMNSVVIPIWNAIKAFIGDALGWLGDHISASINFWHDTFQRVWNAIAKIVSDVWTSIKTTIQNTLSNITSWLATQWHTIQNTVGSVWSNISSTISRTWDTIFNTINGKTTAVKNAVLSPFQQAASAIGGIVRGFGNTIIDNLNHGINGGGQILDWLGQRLDDIAQKLIGSRPIAHFAFQNIPHFAKGTDSFSGGLAVVGEEGPELVSLPRGSKVMPARETAAFLQGRVPAFAGGIGDLLGDIGNFFSSRINDLKGAAVQAMATLIKNVPFLGNVQKLGGVYGSLAGGAMKNVQSWGLTALQHWLANFGAGGSSAIVSGGHMAGTLPGYLLMNQLALTDRNKDNDCVPTSLASAVSYDLKRVVSATSLKDAVYGAGYMGGQSPSRYAPYLQRMGIAMDTLRGGSGTLVSYLHRYLSAGIPVLASIPSDWNNANAQGSTHEVAFAGQTSGHLIAMNPWRGFWQAASDSWWMPRLRFNTINPIRKMAMGGIINEPVFGVGQSSGVGYLLGENGPETVTPGAGGGSPIHVHVYLNGKEINNHVGNELVHHIRTRTGRKL